MRNNQDRNVISDEPDEVEYIQRQFENKSHAEVERAINEAKSVLGGSESRDEIMESLRRKLK